MDILEHGGCIFIVGSLGGGKSLGAVKLMSSFLQDGRRVATNMDIDLGHLYPDTDKDHSVIRLPDYPKKDDFEACGMGSDTPKQRNTHGLIVLDECGTWLNSRDAMDKDVKKDRLLTIKLFLDIRKLGWSVVFLVQDEELVDKQIRRVMMQFRIEMKNTQQMPVPIFGFLARMITGKVWTLPKGHIGLVRYIPNKEQLVDWWLFKGEEFYDAYDTEQVFDPTYEHHTHSSLTNYHKVGRYLPPPLTTRERIKAMIQNYSAHFIGTMGILFGIAVSAVTLPAPVQIIVEAPAQELVEETHKVVKPLPEIDFTDFYIESHYRLGARVFMTIANGEEANSKRITTEELTSMGFFVLMLTECKLQILNEQTGIGHEIYCKKPEVKYLDPYDFSHLPTGKTLSG